MRVDGVEGEMKPYRRFSGRTSDFHMPIDERISNNFCTKHQNIFYTLLLHSIPHNHDGLHKFRGAKASLGSLRLPGQHLYDTFQFPLRPITILTHLQAAHLWPKECSATSQTTQDQMRTR
jgi:hypothetical protein